MWFTPNDDSGGSWVNVSTSVTGVGISFTEGATYYIRSRATDSAYDASNELAATV